MSGLLETPAGFFLTATTLLLAVTLDRDLGPGARPSRFRGVLLGCLLGLSFLLRYDLLALVPAAAAVLWIGHGRRGFRVLTYAALGFVLVVGPWVARNLVSFGSPVAFLGIDRNVLWSTETDDPYASGEYVGLWEQISDSPELLDVKLANLSWPLRHWFLLFGWGLPWLGPAFLATGVVLRFTRHHALRPWVFVALAFVVRWLIFSLTHHEPRFYVSFAPLFLLFAVGGACVLLVRLASRAPAARWAAFATLAALLVVTTVPPGWLTSAPEEEREGRQPRDDQYAVLRARTPPRSVIATTFGEGVAWDGQRPSVAIEPKRIAEVQGLGVRVDGLLYGTWARKQVERALERQGLVGQFVAVDVGPKVTLWLRRRFADKQGVSRGGRSP